MKLNRESGVLLHRSAARFPESAEILVFPNLETVIFITFFHDKFLISECFTHTDDGTLKSFFLKGRSLIFKNSHGENPINAGVLLYASGMTDLGPYLEYLVKVRRGTKVVLVPAKGGRLEELKKSY